MVSQLQDNNLNVSKIPSSNGLKDAVFEKPTKSNLDLDEFCKNSELEENIEKVDKNINREVLFPGEEIMVIILCCFGAGAFFDNYWVTFVTLIITLFLQFIKKSKLSNVRIFNK